MRALWRVQSTDPGFITSGILSVRTQLPFPKYNKTSTRDQFYDKVLTDVRRLPGVTDAAYITALPMTWGGGIWPVEVNGRSQIRTEGNSASLRFVTPGLFSTLGIPIRSGRAVSDTDTADRPYVAVVSQSFVQRYWPNEQPIGRHFKFGMHDHEVIGIVGDIRARGLERTSEPQVYLSSKQDPDDGLTFYAPKDLVIHSSQPPERLLPAIRQIIHAADAEQPISNIRTMDEVVAGETESRTIQMRVLVVFTGVAIVLAGLRDIRAARIHGVDAAAGVWHPHRFGCRPRQYLRHGITARCRAGYGRIAAGAGACLHCSKTAGKLACRRAAGRSAHLLDRSRVVSDHYAAGDAVPCAPCCPC